MNPSEFLDVVERLQTRMQAGNARSTSTPGELGHVKPAERKSLRSFVGAWFSEYRPSFVQSVGEEQHIIAMDEMMQSLLRLASQQSARRTVVRSIVSVNNHFRDNLLIAISRAYWSRAPGRSPAGRD